MKSQCGQRDETQGIQGLEDQLLHLMFREAAQDARRRGRVGSCLTKAPGLENDEEGEEDAHLDLMSAGLGAGKAIYVRGDSIRVIRGDLKHLTGTVLAIFG